MKPSRIITFLILIHFGMNIHGHIIWKWAYTEPCRDELQGIDVNLDVDNIMATVRQPEYLTTPSFKYYSGSDFGDIWASSPVGNTASYPAEMIQTQVTARLNGTVTASGVPLSTPIILYQLSATGVFELVDLEMTSIDGTFSFDISNEGSYLIRANCWDTDHVNTYYNNAFLWDKCNIIQVNSDTIINTLDIDLISVPQLSGSHHISGKITDDKGQPYPFFSLFLVTGNDTPVAHIHADAFGDYEFTNVPVGSYKILLDTIAVYIETWYSIEITNLKSTLNENFSYDYQIKDGMIYATGVATGTDTRTECESYTWIDGTTYTESNNTATFIINGGAANGCDSIVTLNLTILHPATGTDTRTECESYTWIDGNTYTESDNTATFTIVGGAANGCDSIVTLDLTIVSVNTGTTTTGSTITSDASGATYQWLDCNNSMAVLPGETNQSFTAASSGNYAVEVTENGCTDISACTEITVVNEIENSLEEQFLAYPNPTSGMVTIEFEKAQEYLNIRLMSATGQMVETTSIRNSAKKELEIKGPAGNYFIEISDKDGRRAILSIIKN